MIALAEAQARLIAMARRQPPEECSLAAAAGRWLASPVIARRTQPARDLSAMDGYAVAAGPGLQWQVIGESAAGKPYRGTIGPGLAVRIFTGAALPAGADTIIIQEDVRREGDRILLAEGRAATARRHVRSRGSDFAEGDCLLEAGQRLGPAQLAVAAAGGHGSLQVVRRPRVAVLATGSELVPPGSDPGEDHLPESNATMLCALFEEAGAAATHLGIAPDDCDVIASRIAEADADLVVTIGGASVGDHDLVRPALAQIGATLDFWKIAMRPGKPVLCAAIGPKRVVGLPGNPVSAYVTGVLLVVPLLRAMLGAARPLPHPEPVRLAAAVPANGPRTDHLRATLGPDGATPIGVNDSAQLAALARADALIVRHPEAPAAAAGDMVPLIRLR